MAISHPKSMGLGIAVLVATLAIAKQPFKIVTLEYPGFTTLLSLNLVATTGTVILSGMLTVFCVLLESSSAGCISPHTQSPGSGISTYLDQRLGQSATPVPGARF